MKSLFSSIPCMKQTAPATRVKDIPLPKAHTVCEEMIDRPARGLGELRKSRQIGPGSPAKVFNSDWPCGPRNLVAERREFVA